MPEPTIRRGTPADAAAIAVVHTETWKATYAGLIPDHALAQITDRARREAFWREQLAREAQDVTTPTHTLVAEDATGRVAGFVMAGPARAAESDPAECALYAGEVYAIYVHPGAQGQGFGAALLHAAGADLTARGLNGLIIWCLETNTRARGFYERMGGQFIARRDVDMADALIPEVAYGWLAFPDA